MPSRYAPHGEESIDETNAAVLPGQRRTGIVPLKWRLHPDEVWRPWISTVSGESRATCSSTWRKRTSNAWCCTKPSSMLSNGDCAYRYTVDSPPLETTGFRCEGFRYLQRDKWQILGKGSVWHVFVRVMGGELRRAWVLCSVCIPTRRGRDDPIARLTRDLRKTCTDISGDSVVLKSDGNMQDVMAQLVRSGYQGFRMLLLTNGESWLRRGWSKRRIDVLVASLTDQTPADDVFLIGCRRYCTTTRQPVSLARPPERVNISREHAAVGVHSLTRGGSFRRTHWNKYPGFGERDR